MKLLRGLSFAVRHRRGAWRLVAVAAVVGVAAAVAIVAHWHGRGNRLIDRAPAAVGRRPVLHAVIESNVPNESVVGLSTRVERPVLQRLEYWFDGDRRLLRAITRVNGRVLDDEVPPSRLAAGGTPPLDPALTAFVSRYRDALKSGQARETGRGTFDGQSVIWLRFDYRLFGERVGVDEHTYRPVVIEPLDPDGTPARQIWRIRAIDTRAYRPHDFESAHSHRGDKSMRGGNFHLIDPSKAASRLGWVPLWLGPSFRGLPLQHTQLQDLIHVKPASPTTHGANISYGRGADRIQLTEAKTVEATYWLLGLGVPKPGTALLFYPVVSGPGPITSSCQALLRVSGVWVNVEGWNQSSTRCIDAARALVRIAP